MKNKTFLLMHLIVIVICFAYSPEILSQHSPTKWREQMEYAIKNSHTTIGDSIQLRLVKYEYKGVIDSEAKKLKVINMLFSKDAPTVLSYPPVISKDTTVIGDSCIIKEKRYPVFKVISMSEMRKIAKPAGLEDPTTQVSEKLKEFFKIGYEYIELEWNYNDRKIKSICVVSNEKGVVYDAISSNIVTGTKTIITVNKPLAEVDDNENKK